MHNQLSKHQVLKSLFFYYSFIYPNINSKKCIPNTQYVLGTVQALKLQYHLCHVSNLHIYIGFFLKYFSYFTGQFVSPSHYTILIVLQFQCCHLLGQIPLRPSSLGLSWLFGGFLLFHNIRIDNIRISLSRFSKNFGILIAIQLNL